VFSFELWNPDTSINSLRQAQDTQCRQVGMRFFLVGIGLTVSLILLRIQSEN